MNLLASSNCILAIVNNKSSQLIYPLSPLIIPNIINIQLIAKKITYALKGAVRRYCLRVPICNLSTCFIMQMYEINVRVCYYNGGTMEGLCEARLTLLSMGLNSEKFVSVCGRAVISRSERNVSTHVDNRPLTVMHTLTSRHP